MLFYSVKSHKTGNIYYVKIYTTDFHRILCVSPKSSCVKIAVYTDDIEIERQYAQLMAIGFDEECSVEGLMSRGDGTNDVLNCAREFIRRQYPYVIAFTYTDASHIKCNNNTNIDIILPSIAKYRTNWYSNYFGGNVVSKNGEKYLDRLNMFYDSTILIDTTTLIDIINKNVKPIKFIDKILSTIVPIYNRLHSEGKSYRDFINEINKIDCFYLYGWLRHFLKIGAPDCSKLQLEIWMIPINSTNYNVEINEISEDIYIQSGGTNKNFYLW